MKYKEPKSGIYETVYGNAVEYYEGDDFGYDLDMAEEVPVEMIDFSVFVRDLD